MKIYYSYSINDSRSSENEFTSEREFSAISISSQDSDSVVVPKSSKEKFVHIPNYLPFLLTYQTISQAVYHTLKWGDIGHYSNALHNNILLSVFFWSLLTSFWRLWRFFSGKLALRVTCFSMTTLIWGVSWFYFFELWMTVSTAFWEVCLVRFHFVWGLYLNWGWIIVKILLLILDIIKIVHVG